jgi:hypothetical protein
MEEKEEYEFRISRNGKIRTKTKEIIQGIDNISSNMEEDRKHWNASEEVRQLNNIRSTRGMQRILKGN